MSHKLSEIAKELNITNAELRVKIDALGFKIAKNASILTDEIVSALKEKYGLGSSESAFKKIPAAKPALEQREVPSSKLQAPRKVSGPTLKVQIEPELNSSEAASSKIHGSHETESSTLPAAEAPAEVSQEPTVDTRPTVSIPETIVVKELAGKLGRPVTELISMLVQNGIMATINARLDYDTAAIISEEMGMRAIAEEKKEDLSETEENLSSLLAADDPKRTVPRAPVVSVIGHVDHGKTKLLDRIRGTAVMETEAGGITQRIGAYQVQVRGKPITFLDTPGHEAFTAMRSRGVRLTDIAILVVAADDGVMPQTVEAISHARDAGIPLVVAINKIDKPGANPDRVRQQLAEHDVLLEGWGGKIVSAEISALKGTGIDELLELLTIVADLEDLRADPGRTAIGTVIESHLDPNFGPIASVLIHTGTLHLRDFCVIGGTPARIRTMINYLGKRTESAGPSMPILIAGLDEVPQTGDILYVVSSDREARARAETVRTSRARERTARISFAQFTRDNAEHKVDELKLILKADTKGSLEAIRGGLAKIPSTFVTARIIHAGTGDITNSDIMLASVSRAIIIGFAVRALPQVLKAAEFNGVEVKTYDVIYKLLEDVEQAMRGLLIPEMERVDLGVANVLKVFFTGKGEMVVGVRVEDGKLKKGSSVTVIREQAEVGKGTISELKLVSESIGEVIKGNECGLRFKGDTRLRVGDELEVYQMVEKKRSLEG